MKSTIRKKQHQTYADYLRWPDNQQGEIVDGVAYVREPPAPSLSHQDIVGGLHLQIATALEDKPCRVYLAPFDVRLPKFTERDDDIDTVVQPDILIVADERKLDSRGMRGPPDWLAEVLSPGTANHDRVIKVPAYERAGVREVWLIHPVDRKLEVYQLYDGRYGPPAILELKGRTPITAVPDLSIDWKRLLAKVY